MQALSTAADGLAANKMTAGVDVQEKACLFKQLVKEAWTCDCLALARSNKPLHVWTGF
jgi:hypothetical protein